MAWYNDNWRYRKKLTVPGDSVVGSGALTGVPLFFSPSADAHIAANARGDGADILFTSSDGTTKLPHEILPEKQFVTRDGAASWFSRPRAVYHNGASEKLWVSSTTAAGSQQVHEYNYSDETITSNTVGATLDVGDDHLPPVVIVGPGDTKLRCFFSDDTGGNMFMRVSSSNESATSWETPVELDPIGGDANYGYTTPHELNNQLWLFYQRHIDGNDRSWHLCRITDDAGTMTGNVTVFKVGTDGIGNRPYPVSFSNGSRIDFLLAPNTPPETDDNLKIWHCYFDGTTWRNSAGVNIGTPPFGASELTLVYDGTATSSKTWTSDICYKSDGNPHCLFYVYPSGSDTNQDLYYGSFDGSSWTTEKVMDEGAGAAAGLALFYPGVACLDPDDDEIIWACKSESSVYEIQNWTRSSGSWAKAYDVTTGSTVNHFRPNIALNCPVGKVGRLTFMSPSSYTNYASWSSAIATFPALGTNFNKAYIKGDVDGTTDTDFYVYYGNPDATPQEDHENVWDDYAFMFHTTEHYGSARGVYRDASGNLASLSLPSVAVGTGPTNVGQTWVRTGASGLISLGSPNYASATAASIGCWFKSDLTGAANAEHTLITNSLATAAAAIGMRVEPTSGTFEAYAWKEPDTLAPLNPNTTTTGLTATANTYTMAYMGWSAADGVVGRLNKSQGVIAGTTGGTLDSASSLPVYAGSQISGASPTDRLIGEIACMWSLNGEVRAKDFTDTQYDNWVDGNAFYDIGTFEELSLNVTAEYPPGVYSFDSRGKRDITWKLWAGGGGGGLRGGGAGATYMQGTLPDNSFSYVLTVGSGGAGSDSIGQTGEDSSIKAVGSGLSEGTVGCTGGPGGDNLTGGDGSAVILNVGSADDWDSQDWVELFYSGGSGGTTDSTLRGGCGGGGAGGPDSAGSDGESTVDSTGGDGGAGGGTDAGAGGMGHGLLNQGTAGEAYGGGGGGGYSTFAGFDGADGHITLSYFVDAEFDNSLLHRNWLPFGLCHSL